MALTPHGSVMHWSRSNSIQNGKKIDILVFTFFHQVLKIINLNLMFLPPDDDWQRSVAGVGFSSILNGSKETIQIEKRTCLKIDIVHWL